MLQDLNTILDSLPKTITIRETVYYLRLIPITNQHWEVSYFRLNYANNGQNPVLHSEMHVDKTVACQLLYDWAEKNNYINK